MYAQDIEPKFAWSIRYLRDGKPVGGREDTAVNSSKQRLREGREQLAYRRTGAACIQTESRGLELAARNRLRPSARALSDPILFFQKRWRTCRQPAACSQLVPGVEGEGKPCQGLVSLAAFALRGSPRLAAYKPRLVCGTVAQNAARSVVRHQFVGIR